MTFEEILDQALDMLRRRGRVSSRALKVQFHLDDDLLAILTEEIIAVHQLGRDQEGTMLVWTGDPAPAAVPVSPPTPDPVRAPLTYTPPYLAEKIFTSRAALAMQAATRRYAAEIRRSHGLEMPARVGLNAGEVVVRAIGNDLHMDYSAVGQTTHLAARMEQLATPGSIRLPAATLRLAEGLVQVNALGPLPVKGLAEPVEVFELVGASAIRRRLQASAARGLTRFVGRQQELTALAQAGAGHGQVVALVGEAGVGKSRLVYEYLHSHRTHGWLVLESASVSYGQVTPYVPVIDLLKRYVHIEEHDEPRTIRARVTGQVLTLDEALQEIIPALLGLLEALPEDSPFLRRDPPQRRQRTLNALKRVLVRESQAQPLLLVFEDLHWMDSETQALLNSLVESLPTSRLRLLGDIAARREPPESDQAGDYYRQALALTDELGMRPLVAHCHRGLDSLYAKTGHPEQARAELSADIALYRAMEMQFWLPQAEAALAQVERTCDMA